MDTITLPAHFDGDQIRLDAPFELQIDMKLIVTVLPHGQEDGERADWLFLSQQGLENAYSADEPDYSLNLLKEVNPAYAGK